MTIHAVKTIQYITKNAISYYRKSMVTTIYMRIHCSQYFYIHTAYKYIYIALDLSIRIFLNKDNGTHNVTEKQYKPPGTPLRLYMFLSHDIYIIIS